MAFRQIDREHWARKEYFDHYFSQVPCTYSAVFRLNLTNLKKQGQKLYPTMLYHIAAQVNSQEEFRTALDSEGRLGVYDQIHPCYTIFHKENSTFSNLWTEYTPNYEAFCEAYRKDMAQYGPNLGLEAKPNLPPNTFPVSMFPWASFEGFNLNLQKGYDYLLPIFTMGKYFEEGDKTLLPLAIQVHHAVCDGFHLCRFVCGLQERLDG
ncbi:MAG: type A chloramphenicol O-acetyltransferase [Pygmaiobacter massiliensis]|nr:type A chloramphenicol O-acetyltransferase [Pygmaiobacter massiliensis]